MNIKELRLSTGMTQKEFAEYFDIPQKTVENWEQGIRKTPDYVVELIKYKLEKENNTMKTKRTFEEFLRIIHGMGLAEYLDLNEYQKKALEIEYKDKYK